MHKDAAPVCLTPLMYVDLTSTYLIYLRRLRDERSVGALLSSVGMEMRRFQILRACTFTQWSSEFAEMVLDRLVDMSRKKTGLFRMRVGMLRESWWGV